MKPFKRTVLLPIFGWFFLCAGGVLHLLAGCHSSPLDVAVSSSSASSNTPVPKEATPFTQTGYASWYGKKFHGRRTANGDIYDMHALTAAHRKLPFGSYVRVTNLENGKQVVVQITDRGPFGIFHRRRIIDLSYAAAKSLDMHLKGGVKVSIQVISAEEAEKESIQSTKSTPSRRLG